MTTKNNADKVLPHKNRLPLGDVQTTLKDEMLTVSWRFDGKDYSFSAGVDDQRIQYLIRAGMRTWISAAGAGKDKGLSDMVARSKAIEEGTVYRRESKKAHARALLEAVEGGNTEAIAEIRKLLGI